MTDGLSPAALHERLRRAMAEGRELALLDVREELCFGRDGHLLFAVNLPLSRLELRIADMVPRRDTPLITIDGGDDETLASRAAARLRQLGYSAVECLAGGVNGWADAGFEVFDDVNVPIKGFAAATVAQNDTPRIAPADLGRRLTAGETFVLLDSRPVNEFRAGALPGAIVCPGPDLLRRFKDVVPDDKTPVVVNCMTRTRGLLGAQTLIDAGVPNPVYGLDGGTWGWRLAGYDLQAGSQNLPPRLSAQARHHAAAAAERLAEQFSIPRLSREQVSELRADRRRTTYLLDVRSRQEYREGHIPGSISAPGTELVMSPFQHVATLNARLVLADNDGTRALVTAMWLKRMGWFDVAVLSDGFKGRQLAIGDFVPTVLGLGQTRCRTVTAGVLRRAMARGRVQVVDMATSGQYAAGHIPGAWFSIRSRPEALLQALPEQPATVVLTSPGGLVARFAAAELNRLTDRPVIVLHGGTAAWRQSGGMLETGASHMTTPADDVWHRRGISVDGMQAYLDWEAGVLEQIRKDGTAPYLTAPAALQPAATLAAG